MAAQKEWITPPKKRPKSVCLFVCFILKNETKENVQGKKAGRVRRILVKKGKLYPYKTTKKKHVFQQIASKIKLRQSRIRLLKGKFAKYD